MQAMARVSLNLDTAQQPGFGIDTELSAEVCRVLPRGELDLVTTPQLEEELTRVEGRGVSRIVLDLTGLTFMDSSGLHLLLSATARSRASGDRLRIVRPTGQVARLIDLVGALPSLPWVTPRS